MPAIAQKFRRTQAQLRAVLEAMCEDITSGFTDAALQRWLAFVRTFRAELRFETDTLFPLVEQACADQSITRSLRRERDALVELLPVIEGDLREGNRGGAICNLRELDSALEVHFAIAATDLSALIEGLVAHGNPALSEVVRVVGS